MSVHLHPAARTLKLGYLSPHNPYDRRCFSGTSFFAAKALATHPAIELRILGSHRPPGRFDRFRRKPAPDLRVETMELDGLDAVLGLAATPLMTQLADLRHDLPLLHVTDATPRFLREVYGWNIALEADQRETRLAERAEATVYSSHEMAARAPQDLGLLGLQPHVLPFGINFETLPDTCPQKEPLSELNLLFVGLDWHRKGGDLAVQTLDRLHACGIAAKLTLVGKPPSRLRSHPGIRLAGFLNKNRPRDAARLAQLYAKAHLLLLPSRADCTPMVVAEAMAHGTPVLGTETGGLSSLLGGTGTGRMLPQSATPEDWAQTVRDMTTNPGVYRMLSDAAFERAQTGLSWQNWANGIAHIVPRLRKGADTKRGAA